jgi:hypothetical protein
VASPKLKLYQLPVGYAPENDNDVQTLTGDELLPVIDKSKLLEEAAVLTPIWPSNNSYCSPYNLAVARAEYPLSPNNSADQSPVGILLEDCLIGPSGFLELRVLAADNTPYVQANLTDPQPSGWAVVLAGGVPDHIHFYQITPLPSGAKISTFTTVDATASPTDTWALSHDLPYDGLNESFNKVIVRVGAAAPILIAPSGTNREYIRLAAPTSGPVRADFWYEDTSSKYFCGESENWVGDHLNMWPDVFVGTENYPGDSSSVTSVDINGNPVTTLVDPGWVPAFREPSTYQMDFRRGLVTFGEIIDTSLIDDQGHDLGMVRANYAHLVGIGNVTSQALTVIASTSGRRFKASSDVVYPNSIGKRWVGRNDSYLPRNFYVDGVLTPVPKQISAEVLDQVRTS